MFIIMSIWSPYSWCSFCLFNKLHVIKYHFPQSQTFSFFFNEEFSFFLSKCSFCTFASSQRTFLFGSFLLLMSKATIWFEGLPLAFLNFRFPCVHSVPGYFWWLCRVRVGRFRTSNVRNIETKWSPKQCWWLVHSYYIKQCIVIRLIECTNHQYCAILGDVFRP